MKLISSSLRVLTISCALTAGIFAAPSAFAETRKVDIDLTSASGEITQAVGLLLSPGKTIQKPEVTIAQVSPGNYTASFRFSSDEISDDTVATAVGTRANGSMVFGNVRPANSKISADSLLAIKSCPNETIQVDSSRVEVLRRLVEVQLKRRELFRQKITEAFSPDPTNDNSNFLDRLVELEKGFGLTREQPLAADLPAIELVDRLSRLDTAVKGNLAAKQIKAPAAQ